jgi:hypothetical protein
MFDVTDGRIQQRIVENLCQARILLTDNELIAVYAEHLGKRIFYMNEGISNYKHVTDFAFCLVSQSKGGTGGRRNTFEQAVRYIKENSKFYFITFFLIYLGLGSLGLQKKITSLRPR